MPRLQSSIDLNMPIMECYLKVTYFTTQEQSLRIWGTSIWCDITDYFYVGENFTIDEIVKRIKHRYPLKTKTLKIYTRAVLHNILAGYEGTEEEDECPIRRVTITTWQLT